VNFRVMVTAASVAVLEFLWLDPAPAQQPGLKLGYSGSDQTAESSYEYTSVDFEASKHPTIGLFLSFGESSWRWVPSVNYCIKGREDALLLHYYSGYQEVSAEVYDRLEYLSLQSDFHFVFPVGNATFYVLAAPRLDILLEQETTVGDFEEYPSQPDPQLSKYEPTVLGMAVGLGQDIQIGRHTVMLEVRYDWDLEAAWNFNVAPPYTPYSDDLAGPVYNRTLFLLVGLRLWTRAPQPAAPNTNGWPPPNPPPGAHD